MTFYTKVRTQTPSGLKLREQWLVWRWEKRNDKWTKVPYDARSGKYASHSDSSTWCLLVEALGSYESGGYDGIGFVFSEDDPYAGVDFDGVRDPETGAIAEWALEWAEEFGGYCEVSPSGTGLHIIVCGQAPNRKNQKAGVEAYSSLRFFTFTADVIKECTELPERQEVLGRFSEEFFAERKQEANEDHSRQPVDLEDQELLEKARCARGEVGERFSALYDRGDFLDHGSHSEARLELLRHLAFWTGWDEERMSRLYEASALYQMPGYAKKWARLGEREIGLAIAATPNAYSPKSGKGRATSVEVMEVLDDVERAMWVEGEDFKGNAGKTNWNYIVAFIKKARTSGRMAADGKGVLVSIDSRSLTRAAGAGSFSTTTKALGRIGKWVRRVEVGSGKEASTYLILKPKTTARESVTLDSIPPCEETSVTVPRAPFSAPRLRRSTPGSKPKLGLVKDTCKVRQGSKPPPRPAVRRIGPGCNPVVDYLEKVGGSATIEEIADALGMRRPRDLVRKKTAHPKSRDGLATRLLNIGVVEVSSRAEVSLTEEWLESLNDERVRAGEVASERIDRIEHKIAQEEYRTRHERGADVAPTDDELAARREQFKEALERKKLADFLNKRVLALDAMQTDHSGAQINLQRLMDGDMQNVGYLVKSVLSWHRVPPQQWEIVAGEWKKPVLSAANLLAREYAHEGVAA